jgi:hypothetical protein
MSDLRKRVLLEVIDRYYDALPIGQTMVMPYIYKRVVYYFDVTRKTEHEFEIEERHGNPHDSN